MRELRRQVLVTSHGPDADSELSSRPARFPEASYTHLRIATLVSYYVRVSPQRGMRFSSTEIFQLLVAIAALTLAFTLALGNGVGGIADRVRASVPAFLLLLGVSFVAVMTGFILHELAHKVVAQRYGCLAEFRYFPVGLLMGIVTAALGFIFAAPGAVVISGAVTPRQNARISAAGPGTNLAVAAGFLGLAFAFGSASGSPGLIDFLVANVAFVNLLLGGFNLIPVPPLDGSKIFAFNKPMWVGLVVALVGVGAAGWWGRVFF